ncbi:hypothetical protein AB1Y20_008748 [Prymnesium parvum]|uniref:Heterokaryon incompatibility domain-containing protein n=1 Tax=Prymnesium parvum TaxID=97485 RepID=A0AB34ISE1_PRYPA
MSFSEDSPHPESPMRKLLRIGRAATEERCRSIRRLPVERTDSRALLIVVRVDRLEARLAEAPPNQVLHELADATDRSPLLEEVDANQFRCALVSYRQERSAGAAPTPADPTPESTIDAEALVGVVEAAKQLGAEGLWLDAWCYRSRGAYDHADFCRTLRHVVATVHGVVWLPRSKRASAGHYAYRMWCTFEAVVVQQRGLPVQVAGLGVSATQRHVRRFGKYSFWLWGGDGVLDQLARMNAAFYTLILCHVVHLAVRAWRLSFDSAVNDVENFLMSAAVAFTSYPIVWRFCLSMLPEARLATNARRVLRIMAYQTVVASPQGLLRDMALLRAYDRRDALVVASLLQMICPELALGGHAMRALAFCCYAASRLEGRPACGSIELRALGFGWSEWTTTWRKGDETVEESITRLQAHLKELLLVEKERELQGEIPTEAPLPEFKAKSSLKQLVSTNVAALINCAQVPIWCPAKVTRVADGTTDKGRNSQPFSTAARALAPRGMLLLEWEPDYCLCFLA